MTRYISLFTILATLFAGCAIFQRPLPEPSSDGARAYVRVCGRCHALAHPHRNTYTQWEHLVGLMERRMAERGITPMTAEEKSLILGYLKRNSR